MSKKVSTDRNFFLRHVDPVLVLKKYMNGTLLVPKEKIKLDGGSLTPDLTIGPDYNSEVYEVVSKNGESIRIITTEHSKWIQNGKNSFQGDQKFNSHVYICIWCRIENKGEALLIPLKIDKEVVTDKMIFYGTGSYCCFECAYAHLKTKTNVSFYYRDAVYRDSESMLRFMFYLCFGDSKKLVAAPEWTLHQKNSGGVGGLPDHDFFNSRHTYVPLPNVILSTVKTMYMQTDK
jgi:hypothetical protein